MKSRLSSRRAPALGRLGLLSWHACLLQIPELSVEARFAAQKRAPPRPPRAAAAAASLSRADSGALLAIEALVAAVLYVPALYYSVRRCPRPAAVLAPFSSPPAQRARPGDGAGVLSASTSGLTICERESEVSARELDKVRRREREEPTHLEVAERWDRLGQRPVAALPPDPADRSTCGDDGRALAAGVEALEVCRGRPVVRGRRRRRMRRTGDGRRGEPRRGGVLRRVSGARREGG